MLTAGLMDPSPIPPTAPAPLPVLASRATLANIIATEPYDPAYIGVPTRTY